MVDRTERKVPEDSHSSITLDCVNGELSVHVRGYGITHELARLLVEKICKMSREQGIPTTIEDNRRKDG